MEIILDCKCHKIDSDGNIYSCVEQFSVKGIYGFQNRITNNWRLINPTINPRSGYKQIRLHNKMIRMNRLIATYFLPNINNYPECHHKNGNKTDNRVSNLRWGNQKQNAKDRKTHGNEICGSKSLFAKLNENKVKEIRLLRNSMSLNQLRDKYQVSQKLILLVCQRKIWKHVK